MKKLIIAMIIAFAMVGCLDVSSDGSVHDNGNDYSTSHEGSSSTGNGDPEDFEDGLSQDECNDLGFFFCTLENKCLNQPNDAGTCPAR